MTITASARVAAGSRLIDADTIPLPRPRPATRLCPPWCTRNHAGEPVEVGGFAIGQVHERIVTELPAADPAYLNRAATAVVLVESTSEAGAVTTPTRVVLSIAEGPEGAHPGEQDCQGWTGTPDQARALAAALLAAAELVDGGERKPEPRPARRIIAAEYCPTCGEVFHPQRPGTGELCRRCQYAGGAR